MSALIQKLLRDILETTGGDHRRLVAAGQFARPANVTAYAIGQLVANNTVAGNVAALQFAVARNSRPSTPIDPAVGAQTVFSGAVRRARIAKSSTTVANASFRLHLYSSAPVPANGDGAAWSTSQAAAYLGSIDITVDKAFTDGAAGHGTANVAPGILYQLAAGGVLYGLLEARAAYVPTSGETFTVTLEVESD